MRIRSLHIKNYRCFSELNIFFDKQLTVIVGVNGSGKTSILDALSIFLKSLIYSMSLNNFNSNYFPEIHINDLPIHNLYDNINYKIIIDTYLVGVNQQLSIDFVFEKQTNNNMGISLYPEKLFSFFDQLKTNNNNLNCLGMPVAAYYRSRQIATTTDIQSIPNAYDKAFEPLIDFHSAVSWFEKKDADEARKQRKNRDFVDPELKAVKEAVSKALGNYGEPFIDGTPPILYISPKGLSEAYTVEQLSDGYRSMLAMVMDLARRMAMANGELPYYSDKSILHAPAIVLIDEIELHLHPSWQQTVLPTLMEIFPNVQFIVTTHSDQVLTSIPSKHILILEDGMASGAAEESEGADSSRVLKRILRVDSRPADNDYVKKLNEYSDLVYKGQWDSDRARSLREELERHFGQNSEPRLKELELHIENEIWMKKL
ncbi:MAG: AAA family ATPase [Deltaproteobacteria bacterium]|jgi:predicted ATP-binding protein involved in virulence|nr:AAA family ATPase [Deltaproteobacteria bacterium]